MKRRKDGGVEAPVNLSGLFGAESDDSEPEVDGFNEVYEIQELDLSGSMFKIRQFSWHQANANKVWPGTFNLAEYISNHMDIYRTGKILELGSATGALAIFMASSPRNLDVVTSDISDAGDVQQNIAFNFELNGLPAVPHIAHTWGTGWSSSGAMAATQFKFIIASDILLYVSAYPQLVHTLVELFAGGSVVEFLMSWNRRIPESVLFFENMKEAGFSMVHHGQCVYSFYREEIGAAMISS